MKWLRRLIRSASTDGEGTRDSLSSRTPAPALEEAIKNVTKIADEGVTYEKGVISTDTTVCLRLLEAIDKALTLSHDNPDLLYAKCSAYYLGLSGKSGKEARERLLDIFPDHFDARMKGEHFFREDHLFGFPGWSLDTRTLVPEIAEGLKAGRMVQIVRNGIKLSVVVIVPLFKDRSLLRRIVGSKWELKWTHTPQGDIASHYAMFNHGKGRISRREGFIPHLADPQPRANSGYWLLRRLAILNSCFIAVVDGTQVVYNRLYGFHPELRTTISTMCRDLVRSGPAPALDQCLQAADWIMQNSKLEDMPY